MIRLLTQSDKQMIMRYLKRNEIGTSFLYANIVEFGVYNRQDMRRCADYYGFFEGEELRGKGYCKAVVSEICRRIIAKGKMPTLSVKKNNTPAVRAYNALGFEQYDDYLIVRCK